MDTLSNTRSPWCQVEFHINRHLRDKTGVFLLFACPDTNYAWSRREGAHSEWSGVGACRGWTQHGNARITPRCLKACLLLSSSQKPKFPYLQRLTTRRDITGRIAHSTSSWKSGEAIVQCARLRGSESIGRSTRTAVRRDRLPAKIGEWCHRSQARPPQRR